MSLNTKQRRGSAIDVGMPHRQWLANPSGDVDYPERISLLKLCSSVVDETAPLEVPGIEYVWRGDRQHFVWKGTRAHLVWRGDRLHYHGGEEL